jgi:hypothetical protein
MPEGLTPGRVTHKAQMEGKDQRTTSTALITHAPQRPRDRHRVWDVGLGLGGEARLDSRHRHEERQARADRDVAGVGPCLRCRVAERVSWVWVFGGFFCWVALFTGAFGGSA